MNDPQIVELFWDRDESAITEAQRKYGAYCLSVASNILGSREDAEECVNDAFLGAWRAIPPHRPQVLSAFLGKITRRLALKRLRDSSALKRGGGRVQESYEELENCLPAERGPEEAMDAMELSRILNEFLAGLPDLDQRFFVCRYWYFDTVEEIALRFGCGTGKVKMRLKRVRDRLARHLREEGYWV